MRLSTSLVFLSSLSLLLAQSLPANWPTDVVAAFEPQAELSLEYPAASIDSNTAGQLVSLDNAAPEPLFRLEPAIPGPLIIIMIDPDAPTPQQPNASQILHMLQSDFAPSDATPGFIASTNPALATYRGPGPPAGSDAHRYIFTVFQQPAGFALPVGFNATNRRGFNVTSFAELTGLGAPVAGTFFTAKRDGTETGAGNGGSPSPAVSGSPVVTGNPAPFSNSTIGGSGNNATVTGSLTGADLGVSTTIMTSTSTVWMSGNLTVPGPGPTQTGQIPGSAGSDSPAPGSSNTNGTGAPVAPAGSDESGAQNLKFGVLSWGSVLAVAGVVFIL